MKINLLCFPFAGGSGYSYLSFGQFAPRNIKLSTFELPGRGKRMEQPFLPDVHAMANDLFNHIKPLLQEPYAFYGHSMGTLMSYLLTKRIVQEGLPQPLHLFVSGRFGPSQKDPEPPMHNLPPQQFRKKLRDIGGSPDELLDDDSLLGFFEPILRSDFRAIEEYVYEETTPFNVPITVMIGKDEDISTEAAMAWQKETTRPIELLWFEGQHFFIFQHAKEIMQVIGQKLQAVSVSS